MVWNVSGMVYALKPQCAVSIALKITDGETTMARKIEAIKRRVHTSYPEWKDWNIYQKSVLIMRSSMGKIPTTKYGSVDPMNSTIMAYAKKLNIYEQQLSSVLDSSLLEALSDYDKDGEYRKGLRRNGSQMKRATTTEELMQVFTYESTPSTYVSLISGARKSVTNNEAKSLELWQVNEEAVEKIRYIDSSRKQEKYYMKELRKAEEQLQLMKQKYEPDPDELTDEDMAFEPYYEEEEDEEEIL